MKRVVIKQLCLALLIALIAASAVPAFAYVEKKAYVVNPLGPKNRLNVHGTPSIDNVIDHLDAGTVVLYQYSDDGWWYVEWRKANNQIAGGYVDGDYLTAIDADKTAKFACVDNLYVHSQPEIVPGECANYHTDQLKKDEKVTVLKQQGTWAYVEYKDGKGWVASIYLKK